MFASLAKICPDTDMYNLPGWDDPENEKLRLKAQICRNCDTVKTPLRSNVMSLGLWDTVTKKKAREQTTPRPHK